MRKSKFTESQIMAILGEGEARLRFTAVDWLPDADALNGSARAIKELVGQWTGR